MPAATAERGGTRLQGYSTGPGASSQAIAYRKKGRTEGREALLHSVGVLDAQRTQVGLDALCNLDFLQCAVSVLKRQQFLPSHTWN